MNITMRTPSRDYAQPLPHPCHGLVLLDETPGFSRIWLCYFGEKPVGWWIGAGRRERLKSAVRCPAHIAGKRRERSSNVGRACGMIMQTGSGRRWQIGCWCDEEVGLSVRSLVLWPPFADTWLLDDGATRWSSTDTIRWSWMWISVLVWCTLVSDCTNRHSRLSGSGQPDKSTCLPRMHSSGIKHKGRRMPMPTRAVVLRRESRASHNPDSILIYRTGPIMFALFVPVNGID
ncbi:hypothetical protein FIBSPDRAFT_897634 [Athelia psychrophila]|uniref:Uncharacterized protein n=1 Tax=Athelia psychrophila TaxID=1759441 RepID=A0A166BZB3_9AGAM|nr:hypothetical protein FIBSPDRAFT_897634 [Fibularhizoctonia sp. CBS 109695]